ncbi:MAG TPA: hypothetical protein HA362_00925 [Nanoarchaeota archaeon]|nr:hypothetical protein [Nanoarchaeota archaeon]
MNKTLVALALGIGALSAGCPEKRDVSAISEDFVVLARPQSCERVTDIRKYQWGPNAREKEYQILCEQDGGIVLYSRISNDGEWTSITVK